MREQILIQDTLKYLANNEYEKCPVSRESVAAELALAQAEADSLLSDLETAELIGPGSLKLTATGQEYALHVLRAHRLYETYLASKTGVHESKWHEQAHIEEHKLTPADVDRLDRELDYPRFDPHGDPIPTASGLMPPKVGQQLTNYCVGWEGRVVHVEDEPPQLYAQIAAASIAPLSVLRVIAQDEQLFRVAIEGCEFSLSLAVARQITVVPLAEGESYDESLARLSSLKDDEHAAIVRLSPLCRGLERNRLLDLGFVPKTDISIDLVSPSGSPTAYRVRGASIALRREQADRVLIRKLKDDKNG